MKWSFIPQGDGKPHYLVVNADEGEPGTCKDIPLMMADPHSLVEGMHHHLLRDPLPTSPPSTCAARRCTASAGCRPRSREAYAAGYLGQDILGSGFDLELVVHAGAGAYICGEETALLDSLEGQRGQPRLKPPFPATAGLYASPDRGQQRRDDRQRAVHRPRRRRLVQEMGRDSSPGPKIYSLSGHVTSPGQYEAPMGTTLRELLEMAGGMRDGIPLKFWTPGGCSTPLFTAEHLDVPLDFDGVAAAGSMLGTTALQMLQRDRLDAVGRAEVDRVLRARVLRQVHPVPGGHLLAGPDPAADGARRRARPSDLDTLLDTCDNIAGPLVLRAR